MRLVEGNDNGKAQPVTREMPCEVASTTPWGGELLPGAPKKKDAGKRCGRGMFPHCPPPQWTLNSGLGEYRDHEDGLKLFFFSTLFCPQHTGNYNRGCSSLIILEVNRTHTFQLRSRREVDCRWFKCLKKSWYKALSVLRSIARDRLDIRVKVQILQTAPKPTKISDSQ